MSVKVTRRKFMAATAAGAALAAVKFPAPAIAQNAPFKLGLLTVKTGPLAQGGIQMEQGIVTFLKEKNYTFAGRKVEFISADTGGNPAGTKTKAQELIERDQGRHHRRAARRLRIARHHRLHSRSKRLRCSASPPPKT